MANPVSKNRADTALVADATQPRQVARASARDASGSRRRVTDAGTAFLRARPLVVAPVAAINAILLSQSGASATQRVVLGAAFGTAIALFFVERWWLGRREVSERWLGASLLLTVGILALGCALSGGVVSPLFPLVLAPVVICIAAFGRTWLAALTSAVAFAIVAALALVPSDAPFAPIPDPWRRAMLVTSFGGLLALCYAGVAGLVSAYVRTGEMLERMRVATLEEAAGRMRATEQVGAKLAHELKNPLAAIKALLQILRDRVDEKGTQRLEVALGEVDRMDAIVRDYLSFARPLAELERARVDLRGLADDVVSVLSDRAQLRGVALSAAGDALVIDADARRLREALFNLTDNAIAATPAGGTVTIDVARAGTGARLRIEDTGTGMDPALAEAPSFTTTRPDGTGLGLTIARGAITQHGGELRFTPRPGGGTMAIVILPPEPGATLPAEPS